MSKGTNRPTIIDVAKSAGVSKSTVSLVLQHSSTVKEETRERVQKAIEDTGYVYNRGAANMRGNNTGLVGLIINDLRNPYYTELAASTQQAFAHRGYATVIADTNEDPELERRVVNSMLEHGVDAFLMAPTHAGDGKAFDDILRAGTPAMQVLRKSDDRIELFPHFSMDYQHGSYLAAQHLINNGCKKIAFVGGLADREITNDRMSGLAQFVEKLEGEPSLYLGDVSRAFGYQTAIDIAKNSSEIDGIMTFNDLVAIGMMAGFAAEGIKVGQDIQIIGFDDIEESRFTYPTLSTIHCDVATFGKSTADVLIDWLENDVTPQKEKKFPVKLVARDSSAS